MSITLERIFELVKASGKSEYAIKKETGLKNSVFSEWRAGRANPSTDSIIILAKYFGVSTDYLLGLTDETITFDTEQINQAISHPIAATPHIVAHIDIIGTKSMVADKKALAAEFARTYEDLIQDENFRDTAKLFNYYSSEEIRTQILEMIIDWLSAYIQRLHIDYKLPNDILGRK